MKKNILDFNSYIKNRKLNEGWISSLKSKILKAIKKVGNFFIYLIDEAKALSGIMPVNIGILQEEGRLPKGVTYQASMSDNIFLNNHNMSLKTNMEYEIISKRGSTIEAIEKSLSKAESFRVNEAKVKLEHPDPAMRFANIDTNELIAIIEDLIENPLSSPVMIWGAPGIGKTAVVKQVLKVVGKGKKRLIDATLTTMSQDDFFLPYFKKDTKGEIINADDLPKSFLPLYKPTGDPEQDKIANDIANGEDGGVIFFDELSRAVPGVQNVCLKLINERKLGQYVLGDKWAIISASNRAEDDPYSVQNFSIALGNRFLQYNYVPDYDSWKEWAENYGFISPEIIQFLDFNRKYFFDMDTDSTIYASPRTWEIASTTLARFAKTGEEEGFDIMRLPSRVILRTVAAAVGSDAAEEFLAYVELKKSIKLEDLKLVYTDPDKAPLPPKVNNNYRLDAIHAMISSIVERIKRQPTPKEFENFCRYLVRLKDESFAAKAFKLMLKVYPEIESQLGEDYNKHKPDYDKYAKGVEIFIEGYPRLAENYDL